MAELTRSLGVAEREAAQQRGVAEALKLKLPNIGRKKSGTTPSRRRAQEDRLPALGSTDARAERTKRRRF